MANNNTTTNVKKFTSGDRDKLLDFLSRDQYNNLFMIGNINTFGMEDPELEYWGYYKEDNLIAVMMRYRYTWGVYQEDEVDYYAFGSIISNYNLSNPDTVKNVNGYWEYISHLFKKLYVDKPAAIKEKYLYLMKTKPLASFDKVRVRRATLEDLDNLVELYTHQRELKRDRKKIEYTLTNLRTYVAEIGGTIVSTVSTNTESSDTAVLGGLFTPKFLRGQGYATACVAKATHDLIEEGKKPCIFNDDPSIDIILKKIGFDIISKWKIINYE